jgi:hypothetical protein
MLAVENIFSAGKPKSLEPNEASHLIRPERAQKSTSIFSY